MKTTKQDIADIRAMYLHGHPMVIDMCDDILESRELIKEMSKKIQSFNYMYDPETTALIKKSKDYAK